MYEDICMCGNGCLYVYACICMYIHTCVYVYMCVHLFINACVHVCELENFKTEIDMNSIFKELGLIQE